MISFRQSSVTFQSPNALICWSFFSIHSFIARNPSQTFNQIYFHNQANPTISLKYKFDVSRSLFWFVTGLRTVVCICIYSIVCRKSIILYRNPSRKQWFEMHNQSIEVKRLFRFNILTILDFFSLSRFIVDVTVSFFLAIVRNPTTTTAF